MPTPPVTAVTAPETSPAAARDTSPAPRVLLSVEAAAERLSISRTRMYALIKHGEITSVRVGRLRRIPATALTEFTAGLLAAQCPPSTTPAT